MSRLDIVIFGATGFTGKAAVAELSRLVKKHEGMTWGVAGRSLEKLQATMVEVSNKTGEDLSHIETIIADVKDEESLKAMCNRAKVIANCCGPYRLYGEPVIKAAIECRAHYVDVSGEPQFIETMQLKYHKQAEEAGVYVVSACGFDSIPNDMGVIYLQKNFGGTLNTVESYISMDLPKELQAEVKEQGLINYGTWESLVHSMAHMDELKPLRQQMYPDPLPPLKPKINKRSVLHKREGQWCLPFLGADLSIVYRTQRFLFEEEKRRPVQFRPYIQLNGFFQAIGLLIGMACLFVMTKWQWSRGLLLAHPRLFSLGLISRRGPTPRVMQGTHFAVLLHGTGWADAEDIHTVQPNKHLTVKISGKNPGYGATVVGLLLSAFTVLNEAKAMPGNGGVLTTGIAFKDTNLINNLNKNDFLFEIVGEAAKAS